MSGTQSLRVLVLIGWTLAPATAALAQGTAADYERANGLRSKYASLVVDIAGAATWIDNTHHFWYGRLNKGVYEFVLYDADTQQKRPAFDHEKVATALSKPPAIRTPHAISRSPPSRSPMTSAPST